ncbi:SusC/RagA family TonB-linked outer membrane protein [Maribacter polysaccharolyticus]|uniref:SusC/RagA family TonB-linked outer membrane protein n=1 Tax=Maribacter polysaccharolyticus TaxID=3020831 RepID=UPI00237FBAAE|nr:SusC/RagA family TonB-linked outer membrane protein [Maribacter polysaccharolyticus]MDE3742935.1 SusC/RagA family TonB-linked outer membrane protein [Maribacter polysaccharolyticus]
MKKIKQCLLLAVFMIPIGIFAQTTVNGTVTDQLTGGPLPGVSIVVIGTSTGTTTDFDGYYTLSVDDGAVLQFSYIGYKTLEVAVTGPNLDLVMEEDRAQLDEVVVIGYGTTTVKDATGSVEAITSEDFNKGAIVSTDQLLTGKAAGVRITNSGGAPDAAPNIRIRGGASLSASNNPLIVIDGVPLDISNPAGVNNPLSLVNPNDVDSFSILKDASATAIYGSRASNGVIIITTKKGTSGKPQFNLSVTSTISEAGNTIDVMDGPTFERFINEYHPTYSNLLGVDGVTYNTDWQDAILRTAVSQDVSFSARANLFEKLPIRFSLGYNNTEGLVKRNDYERFTTSLKLTPTFFDEHLKVDVNAKGIKATKYTVDESGALGGAISMDPTKPIYDDASIFGGYYQSITDDGLLDGQWNPVALLMQRSRPENVAKFLGNVELDYKMHFLPELRAVLNLGLEYSESDIEEVYSDNAIATYELNSDNEAVFNPGVNYREDQVIRNHTMDAYLVYAKELEEGPITRFDVQGGYSYQNFVNDGTKEEYDYNDATGLRYLVVDESNPDNRYYTILNLQSFFGRTNINIADKYLLTASIRADGSSLFSEDNRWGYFPAVALAWKINEENFLKDVHFVNDLKLRLGWGKTGQQDVTGVAGYFPYRPLFIAGSVSSQYLEGTTLYSAAAFNEDLTWEKTTTYNAGLDFGFFPGRRISGTFDVFYRETTDLLAEVPVAPGQALASSFIDNVGTTESKGFELSLNFTPVQTRDVNLEFNTNIAYSEAEVTDLEDVTTISATESSLPTGTGVYLADHAVGEQPYSALVFKQLYDEDGNPIHDAFADFTGDGVVDDDDMYYRPLRPNWTFGFGFNFNYKKFDFSSSFRGQIGGEVYNAVRLSNGYTDNAIPNNSQSLSNVLDFYSGAADSNFVDVSGNVPFSDYYLEDASFLRCESIVLGYTIDQFKNMRLRLFGVVNNPFIITNYSGQDPENFNAIDNNFYPRPRSISLGLNLDF